MSRTEERGEGEKQNTDDEPEEGVRVEAEEKAGPGPSRDPLPFKQGTTGLVVGRSAHVRQTVHR